MARTEVLLGVVADMFFLDYRFALSFLYLQGSKLNNLAFITFDFCRQSEIYFGDDVPSCPGSSKCDVFTVYRGTPGHGEFTA